jgi:hypothetical protein
VEQLHTDLYDLVVIPLDLVQFLGDMHPVMVGNLDVATLDDDVHS